mgnify:CR=1 FL=1
MKALAICSLLAAVAASGCTSGLVGTTLTAETMHMLAQSESARDYDESVLPIAPDGDGAAFVVSDQSEPQAVAVASDDPSEMPDAPSLASSVAAAVNEEVVRPDVEAPSDEYVQIEVADDAAATEVIASVAEVEALRPSEEPTPAADPPAAEAMAYDSPDGATDLHTPQAEPVEYVAELPGVEQVAQAPEVIEAPRALRQQQGSLSAEEDRIHRSVLDVTIDIRPPAGSAFPEDMAAEWLADQPTIDETFPSDQPAEVFCRYTPWTICYRPLYFEDIKLERYGCNVGYLQTGLSGVRFFSSIAALPYKMTRRPPRSCQCSNGFSRCGDCPLPGYGNRRFQWDAALVETAIVTGFVFILP